MPDKSPIVERHQITDEEIDGVLTLLRGELFYRLHQKGRGIAITSHEILGIITEEYTELIQATRNNDHEELDDELMDLGVACLLGSLSIRSQKMQW